VNSGARPSAAAPSPLKLLLVCAVMVGMLIAVVVSFFASGDDDTGSGPRAGWDASPRVWDDIQSAASCSSLQQMLSTAQDNNRFARELGSSTAASEDIVGAVRSRMAVFGC
jgi:hypothetical protein